MGDRADERAARQLRADRAHREPAGTPHVRQHHRALRRGGGAGARDLRTASSDPMTRWLGDGRPYEFQFDNALGHVELTDESGKIDLNTAGDDLLQGLFVSAGLPMDKAMQLSGALQDWRDPDDASLPNGAEASEYKSAGLSYVPRNSPFQTVSEVQQVLGMNYELYSRIEPAITIYAGGTQPNAAYAPLEALLAMPGMT